MGTEAEAVDRPLVEDFVVGERGLPAVPAHCTPLTLVTNVDTCEGHMINVCVNSFQPLCYARSFSPALVLPAGHLPV